MTWSIRCAFALTAVMSAGCGPQLGTIAVEPSVPTPKAMRKPAAHDEVLCDRVLEDFGSSAEGTFPDSWHTRTESDKPLAVESGAYVVAREGGKSLLHATYRDEPITIALPIADWDLEQYPILQWSWRAAVLPENGDEREGPTNDSAAGVYVVWEIGVPFMIRSIKYAWSTTLPVGTTVSRRLGHDKVVVMSSGREPSDGWRTVRVNVKDHYRKLFERDELERPGGIAILTDADSTGTQAEAYYADIRLCREAKR